MFSRNKYYIFALALLIAIATFFYFSNHRETFHQDEVSFALPNKNDISSFQIKTRNSSLTIYKTIDGWQFDSGCYANPLLLDICFKVFSQVEIKSPVSEKEKPQIISELRKNGTEIILFKDKKILRDYYLWADTAGKAIFMAQKKKETPFLTSLPSYNGNFAAIFRTEKYFWRDRTILRYVPGQITKVKVEQPANPSRTFELQMSSIVKAEIFNPEKGKIQNINFEAVEAYLYCFRNVRVVKFLKKTDSQYQDLTGIQPDFIITVTARNHKAKTLKIFKRRLENHFGDKRSEKFDLNFCNVTIDNKDTALIRYIDIDPLTRDLGFFLKK
jgi:hypothetical protein